MILLTDRGLCLITPPKTASSSLHAVLCRAPYHGVAVIGPSMWSGNVDKHTTAVPNEAAWCRVLVVVRHPLDRLVSLYMHYAREEAYHGRFAMAWWEFANRVCRSGAVTHTAADAIYSRTIDDHLRDVSQDVTPVRCESLSADLAAQGIEGLQLPRENASHRKPWRDYYDASLTALATTWAQPDLERFGYVV